MCRQQDTLPLRLADFLAAAKVVTAPRSRGQGRCCLQPRKAQPSRASSATVRGSYLAQPWWLVVAPTPSATSNSGAPGCYDQDNGQPSQRCHPRQSCCIFCFKKWFFQPILDWILARFGNSFQI